MGKSTTLPKDKENTMTHSVLFKTFKRLNPFEHCLSISGFFLVALMFIGCFFYLDYQTVAYGLCTRGIAWLELHGSSPRLSNFSSTDGDFPAEFLDEGGDGCDVFDGFWVWDDSYPLYDSQNCPFADGGFRCSENGRPDHFYIKWRWQPKNCTLPRFDAVRMLELLRNRRLVFAGDSVARNQWESMLCMLSSVIPNKTSVYEVNGSPITKHTGFLVFKFDDFNCTVEYYRSPFLVVQGRPPAGAPDEVKMTLRVDHLDWTSHRWRDADLLILSTGHWWNHAKTLRQGIYFQEGNAVNMNMTVDTAFRRSIQAVADWVYNEVDTSRTYALFRSYAPVHFSGGTWNTGGGCHLETLPDLGALPGAREGHLETVADVLSDYVNKYNAKKLDLLNVTMMSWRRKDGHPSVYYLRKDIGPASLRRQDCSHWCLPGVPDAWNELVYAFFLKKQESRSPNSTTV